MVQKKKLYAEFGVNEYWIVVPEENAIDIYTLEDNAFRFHKRYTTNTVLESPSITGLKIELSNLF